MRRGVEALGAGSPWRREIRPEMWFCPPQWGGGTVGVKAGSPGGGSFGVPGGRWGLGRGVPLEAWLEADGFREHNLE